MDTFTGLNCEIANTNPCIEQDQCVYGVCINVGQGQYECECQDNYDGIHCDEPIIPIEVSHHPSSQIVNINSNVNLTCGFNHAKRYYWYKTVREGEDGVLLTNSENRNPLMIMSASHNDIGYYFCRGEGRNGKHLETLRASVYLRDLTNIQVLNVRFATPFREELRDQTSMIYKETASNITNFMKEGLRTSTGLEGVSVVCRALRPGSIEADLNIYLVETNMTALDTERIISESIQSMAENSNGFLDSSAISVQNNAICRNISWISPRLERGEFPIGENGTWENSTGRCPFNTTQADGPIGRALCIGDGISQSRWQPMDNCGPFRNVTDILTQIAEASITEENAGEVSQQVEAVSSNVEDITSDDVTLIAEITSSIVQQNVTNEQVTNDITGTLSNVAEVQTDVLEAAGEAVSILREAFEELISQVEVADGEMLNIQQPNVAVQIQSVSADEGMDGLVLSLAGSSLSDLTKANFTISAPTQGDHQDDDIASKPDTIAQVNIPSSVSSAISSRDPLTGSSSNGSGEYIRVNFNVFSTPALFISKSLREFSADDEAVNRSANTPVISVSIGGRKVESLAEPISFTFSTLMSGYVNPMCSFWDDEEADWAQDGCSLISRVGSTDDDNYANSESTQDGSLDERVRCACDHLTNFAVLMDIRIQNSPEVVYNILTYIGCCLSILSLLVTLATYLWTKNLRTKQTSQIFICLCATLLCLYITFVIMISLDSIRDYREVQAGPCGFLSALVHYFVLSSIAWMGVEGYNTYLIIVKIFNTYIPNFMIKACLAAWGVPALIVLLTGVIARGSYAHDDLCFLQFWAQIGGLLIPMSIIIVINIVIFVLVIRQLFKSAKIAGRVKREAEVERRETIERVQNAICILLLLGLTWITGYFLLIPSFSPVAQPIFIVLNSFQGLFIFLLYCVRKPHIRKKWGLTCFDKKKEVSTTSGGVQSSLNPSSTSAGVVSGAIGLLSPGSSGNFTLPTNKADPVCLHNPTYDVWQIAEDVAPPLDNDVQSSKEGQKNKESDETDTGMVSVRVGDPAQEAREEGTK
nr:adhesion G-protein coupled receptor G2-like isoform X1 [Lytechinus pictus]